MRGRRPAIGHDPLDWIGAEGPRGFPRGRTAVSAHGAAPRPDERFLTLPPVGEGGASGARSSEGTTAAALERRLLLLEIPRLDQRAARRLPRRLLLAAAAVAALAAAGAGLLHVARGRWDAEVTALHTSLRRSETQRQDSDCAFREAIDRRDRLLEERQSLVARLQRLHLESLGELRRAWAETQRIQERYERFLAAVLARLETAPAHGAAPIARGDADSTATDPERPRTGAAQEK